MNTLTATRLNVTAARLVGALLLSKSSLSSFLRGLLLLLVLTFQPAAASDWAQNFGLAGSGVNVSATIVDSAGNTYAAGYFDGATLTLGATTLTKIGTQDAFVAKLDATGSVLWAKSYGGAGVFAQANAIAVDASGNVYLGGSIFTGAFAFKFDSNGNTTWARNYGGAQILSIAVDAAGNVYLGGTFGGASFTADAVTLVRIGNYDALALKLDGSGTAVWGSNFGGTGVAAYGYGIAVDASGNVYLGGAFGGGDFTVPALTRIGSQDAFAFKLNSSGATTWAKSYGGAGATARASAIAVDVSGNVYLGGHVTNADLTTPALTRFGNQDPFAFKLDSSGTLSWAKNFGGAGANAYATGIAVDASGNVYLGGSFINASLTAPALTKIGVRDAFAFKLDNSGTLTLARNFGGAGAQAGISAVAADAAGNIYLGGYFGGANLTTPTLTKIGSADALLLKQAMLPVVGSLAPASGGVSGCTVVTLTGGNFSGATAVNFGANAGAALTVNSATSITVTTPASSAGVVDVTVTTPAGTGGTGNGLFTYAITAPSQPAAPSVTLTGNLATVSFTAPADNGSAITGYTVATSSAGGVDLVAGTTATTHHIVGLAAGTAYGFSVVAANAIGSSAASSSASASTPASFAGENFGSLGANTNTTATAVDSAGNHYVTGGFNGATLVLGATTLTKIGTQDAFVAKLDASGTVLWAKNFGGSGASAQANAIAVDASGNVYLGGSFYGANLTAPALSLIMIGSRNAFAFKLDSSGATAWAKDFGGAGAFVEATGIAVDASGNVYLGGWFMNADLTAPALTNIGAVDAFAFKLDNNGATIWSKNFGGAGAGAYAMAIAADASGNVYLAGFFESASLTTPALSLIGSSDAFAFKLDSSGAITWANNYGGGVAYAVADGIAVDGSGNVYLGGYFNGASLTTPTLTRIGNTDAFALKLDSSGATTWSTNYGGAGANTFATAIAADASGSVVLGGRFHNANLTTPALTLIGNQDAFLLKSATPPSAPTGAAAVVGNAQASVSFSAPVANGGSAIAGYTVVSSPAGGVDSNAGSTGLSHTITGLANGTSYTFTVVATNAIGTSPASVASGSVTPSVPVIPAPSYGSAPSAPTTTTVAPGGSATLGSIPVVSQGGATVTVPKDASGGKVTLQSGGAPTSLVLGDAKLSATPLGGTASFSVQAATYQGKPVLVIQVTSGTASFTVPPRDNLPVTGRRHHQRRHPRRGSDRPGRETGDFQRQRHA